MSDAAFGMTNGTQAVTEDVTEINEADFSPEADAARMAELHESLKGDAADAEEVPAEDGDEERGPDGKFKAKPKDDKAALAKAKPKAEAEPLPGALGKARRLMREATTPEEVDEACRLAFGVGVEDVKFSTKQWDGFKKRFNEAKAITTEREAAATKLQAEVRQSARNLLPLANAQICLETGDALGFLKLLGSNPDDFQRRLITQMTGHGQPVKDPEVTAQLEQIKRERAAERAEAERLAAENKSLQTMQAAQRQGELIAKELSASEDPRFVKVATKPKFVQRVYELQCEYYKPPAKGQQMGSTITEIEAAELAWDEFYGDVVDSPVDRAANRGPNRVGRENPATTGRGGSTVAGSRPRTTTNVRHAQAAETAPDDDDSQLDYTDDNARRAHEERLLRRLKTYEQSNA